MIQALALTDLGDQLRSLFHLSLCRHVRHTDMTNNFIEMMAFEKNLIPAISSYLRGANFLCLQLTTCWIQVTARSNEKESTFLGRRRHKALQLPMHLRRRFV